MKTSLYLPEALDELENKLAEKRQESKTPNLQFQNTEGDNPKIKDHQGKYFENLELSGKSRKSND